MDDITLAPLGDQKHLPGMRMRETAARKLRRFSVATGCPARADAGDAENGQQTYSR